MFRNDTVLNPAAQDRLTALLNDYVARGQMAGAVAVVAGLEDDKTTVLSVGVQDVSTGQPMTEETIFRIYSLTKPVTSVATLMLVERGLVALDDPVADYIPAFADVEVLVPDAPPAANGEPRTEPPVLPPTVRHLLMHTSGIGGAHVAPAAALANAYREARFDDRNQTLTELVDKLTQLPLLFQPGRGWRYGISTDVLARIVEVVSGQSFGQFLRENLFAPLEMHDTGFSIAPDNCDRLATVYGPGPGGQLRPLNALGADAYCTPPRLEAGSSGLVSTPKDYLNFARMLLGKGTWRGQRLLHPETVQALATNALPPELLPYRLPWSHAGHFTKGAGFGLGVRVLLDADEAGVPGSVGEYGWAGAANTFLWVDPVKEWVLLLFTQAFPFLHTDIDRTFKQVVYASSPREH